MRKALALLTVALGIGGATGVIAQNNPVVVELYTSQGCSSCPPADAMLHDLAKRSDVIALALHVDYWDYIGWKDEFADPSHTQRQRRYAQVAGQRTIYTPQMVIGGQDHIVGNRPMEVANTIAEHASQRTGYTVAVRRSGNTLRIEAEGRAPRGPLMVQLVRYDPEETVAIRRGENAGRTLSYANVVQSWQVLGEWSSGNRWVAETQVRGGNPVVVIVQEPGPGAILASAHLR